MGFIYGLAVIVVIFEGIIIQCEGAPRQKRDAPILPNDIIELIFSKTDFERIQEAAREKIIRANDIVMGKILKNHTIVIRPDFNKKICGDNSGGMEIGNYKGLESFFKKFGGKVKKIEILLGYNYDPRRKITQNIIKRYAKTFEELRIDGFYLDIFWNGLSDGENDIIFPEVKKFQIRGDIIRNYFKLNLIFPKLESFTLIGKIADVNCLENVKGLKELTLDTKSIVEDKLDDIFANNVNMTLIFLSEPNRAKTMDSIAQHLTKLKTLKVQSPGEQFLLRANNSPICRLPSVTHFDITFDTMDEIFGVGNLSFDMPHLEKLTLNGGQADDRIIKFIKYFKDLEILELFVHDYNTAKCIEKLKHIKEFTTNFYENRFASLKNMFTNFDEDAKLQTVKFLHFELPNQKYEKPMKEFNNHLENCGKPKWTLSHEEHIETSRKYLVFHREPCKCKVSEK